MSIDTTTLTATEKAMIVDIGDGFGETNRAGNPFIHAIAMTDVHRDVLANLWRKGLVGKDADNALAGGRTLGVCWLTTAGATAYRALLRSGF